MARCLDQRRVHSRVGIGIGAWPSPLSRGSTAAQSRPSKLILEGVFGSIFERYFGSFGVRELAFFQYFGPLDGQQVGFSWYFGSPDAQKSALGTLGCLMDRNLHFFRVFRAAWRLEMCIFTVLRAFVRRFTLARSGPLGPTVSCGLECPMLMFRCFLAKHPSGKLYCIFSLLHVNLLLSQYVVMFLISCF